MNTPEIKYLSNYQKPDYLIPEIYLEFNLDNSKTIVKSKLKVIQNSDERKPIVLNGEKIILRSVSLNGEQLQKSEYNVTSDALIIQSTSEKMLIEIETEINPEENKALDGLYKSGGIFCTQNEPEGFRKMTYYLDRPDVMSSFTTKIIADKSYPFLLSNGNKIESGEIGSDRHYATWHDPHKKPAYLFALVAGDLGKVSDTFKTKSGRKIDLEIYCDKGNENRCLYAMESLKKSMKWDEDRFGLEYDLDIYMIVAVNDFNFGAMENKGLNIFNSKYVLADDASATDQDFLGIEGVIGHEYFHNWTGNRVTCRDWFQLTLKEGLTVFRDEEFSSDMNSRSVKRIEDVGYLREFQFVEDGGPIAHPIRPESYIEINNFYTSTVYSKGAEVIRMIHTFIGEKSFQKGMDLYFEHFDGQAVTTDHFIWAMEEASGFNFDSFKHWYHQAGTPDVEIVSNYNSKEKCFSITINQSCRPTEETDVKQPFTFPVRIGLLDKNGNSLKVNDNGDFETIIKVTSSQEVFTFKNIDEKPVYSAFRGFSAPVKVKDDLTSEDLLFLLSNDTDEFNRYESGQRLVKNELFKVISQLQNNEMVNIEPNVLDAFGKVLIDENLDGSIRTEILTLPSITQLVEEMDVCDFINAQKARELFYESFVDRFTCELNDIYESLVIKSKSVADRSLKNKCLQLLQYKEKSDLAFQQYKNALLMTDKIGALTALSKNNSNEYEGALSDFYSTWKNDPLVMNKWFAIQVSGCSGALTIVKKLENDTVFDSKNPNNIRSLYGMFIRNLVEFHNIDGSGYSFIIDKIIDVDRFNGNMAASLTGGFKKYKKLDPTRQSLMKKELERLLSVEKLSKDTYEMATKILGT